MIVLITKNTRDESFYYSSIHRERRMKKQLSSFDSYEQPLIAKDEDVKMLDRKSSTSSENKLLVHVDHREARSGVTRELNNLGVKVETSHLPVGDYQIGNNIAIERKSTKDFVSSLIDKRMYKQAQELVENFSSPLVILEGDDLYSSGIHPNAIRGALASLAIDFKLPIIPTRSAEDTAAMIHRISIRELDKTSSEIQTRTDKKPLTLLEQQLFIVESLPNVGPVTARKLLEEFQSVEGVFNASKEELKKVEGIGNKIAESIREVIESDYLKNSDSSQSNAANGKNSNLFGKNVLNGKSKPNKEYSLNNQKKSSGNDIK